MSLMCVMDDGVICDQPVIQFENQEVMMILRTSAVPCMLAIAAGSLGFSAAGAVTTIGPDGGIAVPFPDHDEPSIGVAVTVDIPLGDIGGTTVRFGPQIVYVPYERRDRWEVKAELSAEWILLEWQVFQGRVEGPGPVKAKLEFRGDPQNPLPPELGFAPPGVGAGVEIELPFDGDPKLTYYTELTVGFGEDWYRVELPLFRYSWDTEEGRKWSGLGLWYDLYAPSGSCKDVGGGKSECAFERGELTIWGGIPEPATWGMMIVGFGMVGWQMRRPALTSRPSPS